MRAFVKTLLVLEVVVCFGPMTLMLTMGAALIPIQILALLIEDQHHWEGLVEGFGSVGCGVLGLCTLLFLLSKLLEGPRSQTVTRPWLVFAGAIIGVIPLIDPVTSSIPLWRVLGVMPIVSGLHVLFLSRRILFPPRGSKITRAEARRLPARSRR